MSFRKLSTAVMAGALLACAGWTVASAQFPGDSAIYVGRVYSLHTAPVGGCPGLDWHIVVGEDSKLSGMIATDNMQHVFNVSGQFQSNRTFQLAGHEVGTNIPGALNGQVQSDGRLAVSLGGLPVGAACQGKTIYMNWVTPKAAGGGD